MTRARWLHDNKIPLTDYYLARAMLMTGPRAQEPSWKAIRKTIGRIKRGDLARAIKNKTTLGPWRAARSV